MSGFVYGSNSAAIGIGLNTHNGPQATVSLTDVVLSGGSTGLIVENGATATAATITGSNLTVKNNYFGGLLCHAACTLDLSRRRSQRHRHDECRPGRRLRVLRWHLAGRQRQGLRREAAQRRGDQQRQPVDRQYQHGRQLRHHAGRHGGVELRPGHAGEPGRKRLHRQHDGQPDRRHQCQGRAGIVVSAAGNTFIAGTQGANGAGKYVLGSAPCSASTCNLTSGAGANYRVTSGALTLAP